MLNSIKTRLKNLFNPSVGSLTADICRKAEALLDLSDARANAAWTAHDKADTLRAAAEAFEVESTQALAIASKLRALVS